ncbi:hypothetical protein [Tautonia plasticadhaerens]|uniref:CARDB domain-containing protein n=1 Tax=Tautonia plasticadhaerens TaxID=2527974 RepID=A0A518GY36_9BACT|nr:hypothetical protein [Tautonia plasticadhaerens]QDV33516.1 hypothetical protein ElP_13890 [Tautonia plasticadhaerens]
MTERHPRRGNGTTRTRRRPAPITPEALEGRHLLAYTPLGFSIPDLAILNAYTGPVAAYGGEIAVTVDVSNLGQSSIPEPLAQFPGQASAADAGPSEIEVYYTNQAHSPFGDRILLGTISVPAVPQNRLVQVTGVVSLPEEPPAGYPGVGSNGFITLELDPDRDVRDLDRTNNVFRPAASFLLVPDLPDLQAIALGLPPVLNPGDTIVPQVKVANYGAAPTIDQAPVVVQVVASLDEAFGPGDIVLGTFTVGNILPLSFAPTERFVPGDQTLLDRPNVAVLDAMQPVTLPETGAPYFVGVVVDPQDEIREISELDRGPDPTLELARLVDDSGLGLPPAGVIGPAAEADRPFPYPPFDTPTGTSEGPVDPGTPPSPGEPVPRPARRRVFAERLAARLQLQDRGPIAPMAGLRARPVELAQRLAALRAARRPG